MNLNLGLGILVVLLTGSAYAFRHRLLSLLERPVTMLFHYFYYRDGVSTWGKTRWMGVPLMKLPLDLWRYHDLLWETKPDVIIETGTNRGGSALFMANLCDLMGHGRIVTVDVTTFPEGVPSHPRISYVLGSSTDPEIFAQMKEHIRPGERVMVILDSDHARDHVKKELALYAPLVTKDCYLVVEDTNVNGHPVSREHGPGPLEALQQFMTAKSGFEMDQSLEDRYKMTFYPQGWLKKVAA